MEPEVKSTALKTSKREEEAYLARTLAVVHDNVENYGREVARMQANIDEMLEHYHDNDAEVYTILNNTITLHDHMKRALARNEKAMKKPYFGRIVFRDEALNKTESLYIGRGGISKDTTHWMVVDWRAPVANAYYENGLGKCSYPAPDSGHNALKRIKIDLKMKRTYEIEDGKLLDYYDSEVVTNDELLTKYLAKNKQAVLGEIIATIQKEQNDIIRKTPHHNVIVQGVAGSGKTTVAMHRISYILYNYQERFRPDDFYIVGSNRILLNYITGVLPDLDVYGIRQMTMEQLFVRLLYEDWDEKKYRIRETDKLGKTGCVRGTSQWYGELADYCRRLEWEVIPRETIYLNPRQFVEGLRDGKAGVYDETEGKPANPKDLVELMSRDAVERYIRQNPTISVQSKIDMLNERLLNKVKEEFLGKGVKYTESERKAITRAYRSRYGARVWKRSIYDIYRDFLTKQAAKGYEVEIPEKEFDVYDLAALAYIYKRIKETEVISEAHHVVIDEAQDFGMMAYCVLKYCIRECTYTIMGDVSQNIHFGYGLNDWEELKELLLPDPQDSFGVLKKSYRNTVEISEFATNILHHGRFSSYPVEPIIRHGDPVKVSEVTDTALLMKNAAKVCKDWQAKGFDTIAVVCRNREKAAAAARELKKYIPIVESDLEKAEFSSGIMVLPVEYTKGLEFDAVLILDPTREEYPVDDGHAKLLYVAATRALHELCVLHQGNLTGLIADPLPADAARKNGGRNLPEQAGQAPGVQPKDKLRKPASAGTVPRKRISIVRNTGLEEKQQANTGLAEGQQRNPARPSASFPEKRESGSISNASVRSLPDTGRKASAGIQNNGSTNGSLRPPYSIPKAPARPAASKNTGRIDFGDMPATEKLRPAGHSRIDLAVRWVNKRPDGLYLQSRYGVLRLSPVGSAIVRVTFTKGMQLAEETNPNIAVRRIEKSWKYKEMGNVVEMTTDELCLQVDKATGAIRYLTRDKNLLLSERSKESRQIESGSGPVNRAWLFLDWPKGEALYGLGAGDKPGIKLRGTARYISHDGGNELPLLLSDNGYGILVATNKPVICCDISVYGSYLCAEDEQQLDYYFIGGKKQVTIMNAYAYLCGRL
ncbi:hypothetical protein K070079E91_32290 [Eisenbergiella porci]|uniref:ATP-binding domain-containing protein n=1 Tax=Eisenbergiella porci TaxID=2652274 RepID=UPI0036F2064C